MTSRGYLRKIIDFSDVDSFEQSADAYPHFFIFKVRRRFQPSSKPFLLARNEGIEAVLKVAQEKFPLLEGCRLLGSGRLGHRL
jgi:hypothetical protein